jgi:hypothetical protein
MRSNPFRLLFVRTNAVEIETVRPCVDVAGLKEVDVRVDVTRQNELPFRINDAVAFPGDVGLALDDGADAIAFDFDRAIRDDLSGAGIDNGAVDDKHGARGSGESGRSEPAEESEKEKTFHI